MDQILKLIKKLLYYLALPFLITISYLPFSVLYLLSDFLYLIISKILSYRKKVIDENLKCAFPEKSKSERIKIREKFYRFFSDFVLEVIKMYSLKKKTLIKRINFEHSEALDKYSKKGQSVIIALGHFGNWEWAGPGAANQLDFHFQAIYKRLLNPYFDKLVLHLRSRLNVELLEMKTAARSIMMDSNRVTATAFPMDQRPPPEYAFWINFMNRDAGFFMGPEKIARKMNYPVIYASVLRTRRGYYKMILKEITPNASMEKDGAVIETFVHLLEQDIKNNPEYYLWSHKRWKHKKLRVEG